MKQDDEVLNLIPKDKRAFINVGSSVIVPNILNFSLDFIYMPYRKVYIIDFKIKDDELFAVIKFFKNSPCWACINTKYIYRSITEFAKQNYDSILKQITTIKNFDKWENERDKETAFKTLWRLTNILDHLARISADYHIHLKRK